MSVSLLVRMLFHGLHDTPSTNLLIDPWRQGCGHERRGDGGRARRPIGLPAIRQEFERVLLRVQQREIHLHFRREALSTDAMKLGGYLPAEADFDV